MQRMWQTVLLVLGLTLVGACGGARGGAEQAHAGPSVTSSVPAGGLTEATPATSRPQRTVQVSVTEPKDLAWIVYGLAIESGLAAEEGYTIELVAATANVSISAIANGDLGYTAQVGSAMRAAAQGLDLRVAAIFMDAPLQSLLVRPEIRQASDLVGRAIGVSTSGATAHTATVRMLEALGVAEQQVNWVFLGGQPARFAALDQGLVQGTAILAPHDLRAERDLGYRILVRAADVLRLPFVGIATSGARLRERPDEVKGLIRVGLRTMQFMREQPDEATAVAARWLQMDDLDLVGRALLQATAVLTPAGFPDREGFRRELATLQAVAGLPATPRPSEVADFRLLADVQRELGLPIDPPLD